jgi:hypothetical protein
VVARSSMKRTWVIWSRFQTNGDGSCRAQSWLAKVVGVDRAQLHAAVDVTVLVSIPVTSDAGALGSAGKKALPRRLLRPHASAGDVAGLDNIDRAVTQMVVVAGGL